jgi:hypothetical protein
MNINLLDPIVRKQIVADIKSWENVERKRKSLEAFEIYNDRAYQYVYSKLCNQLTKETVNTMAIVSNLNVAKAVVNKEASVYLDEPEREYPELNESDKEVLKKVYEECGFNTSLAKSNKYFKLNNQSFLQVVPKYGKLKLRVLHGHNIDVIPDADDPETAYAYIISTFDKSQWIRAGQDQINQTTADADDYKSRLERYQVWTKEIVFTMDGKGNVIGEITPNPIKMLPFVDISKEKDFEFYVRQGQALSDFTVDFNVVWSDLMHIMRMQGYSVGAISGDPELKPESMVIGPDRFIFLPTNPANPLSKLEFDFKSPSPNIDASLKVVESLIATFLSTRGVDKKAVSSSTQGQQNFSSALERLLAMIDEFRASKEDFDLFIGVETKLHEIVTKYLALLSGSEYLIPEYAVTQAVVGSKIKIEFEEPEMVETEADELDNAKKKIDLGIADAVTVLADYEDIPLEDAEKIIQEIKNRKANSLRGLINEPSEENA